MSSFKKVIRKFSIMGFSIHAWWYFIKYNFFSIHVERHGKKSFLFPTQNALIEMGRNSKLILNGPLKIGTTQVKGSKIEARLRIGNNGIFKVENGLELFAGSFVRIMDNGELVIKSAVFNEGTQISCGAKIEIGEGCLFARDVVIRSDDVHTINVPGYEPSKPIIIGNHVWAGQGSKIMKGVTIGNGSIVSANALVLKDVPERCIAAGLPAKVIKENIEWDY